MARKRRGRGEGSIFQRADGRWTATITVGYDGNGKRKRRTVYGKTKHGISLSFWSRSFPTRASLRVSLALLVGCLSCVVMGRRMPSGWRGCIHVIAPSCG